MCLWVRERKSWLYDISIKAQRERERERERCRQREGELSLYFTEGETAIAT